MPKRPRSKRKNPFVLYEAEVAGDDDDEEDEYVDDEELSEGLPGGEPDTKRRKGNTKGKGEKASAELTQAIREADEREKNRPRLLHPFLALSGEQLEAFVAEHYGGDDDEEEELFDDDDDDGAEGSNPHAGNRRGQGPACAGGNIADYIDELKARRLQLWMVKCRRRAECSSVKKMRKKVKSIRQDTGEELPHIGDMFRHAGITGFYWVEAVNRAAVVDLLRSSRLSSSASEKNIRLVPMAELTATYQPKSRTKADPERGQLSALKEGMNVRVVGGPHAGREGIVVKPPSGDDPVVTVFSMQAGRPTDEIDESVLLVSRHQLAGMPDGRA